MLAYIRLEVLRIVRNWRYLAQVLAGPLLLYLLFARQLPGGSSSPALMASLAAYGAIGAAFAVGGPRLTAERAIGWTRLLRVTPLPPAAYVVAKLLVALVLALPAIVAVELAGATVSRLTLPLGTWLALPALLLLGTVPFAVLGVLLGYLFNSDTVYVGTQLVYVGLALLGGLWFPLETAPRLVRAVGETLPSHQLAELSKRAVAGQGPTPGLVAALALYTAGFAALAAWRYRRDEARGWD